MKNLIARYSGQPEQTAIITPPSPRLNFMDGRIDLEGTAEGQVLLVRDMVITVAYPIATEWFFEIMVNDHMNSGQFSMIHGNYWIMKEEKYRWFKLEIMVNGVVFPSPLAFARTDVWSADEIYTYNVRVSLYRGPGAADVAESPPERDSQLHLLMSANGAGNFPSTRSELVFSIPKPEGLGTPITPPTGLEFIMNGNNAVGMKWAGPIDSDVYIYAVKADNGQYISAPTVASARQLEFSVPVTSGDEILLRAIKGADLYDSAPITVPGDGGGNPGDGIKPIGVVLSADHSSVTWESPAASDVYLYAYANDVPISAPTQASKKTLTFTRSLTYGQQFWLLAIKGQESEQSDIITVPNPGNPEDDAAGGDEELQPQGIVVTRPAPRHVTMTWDHPVPNAPGGGTGTKAWALNADTGAKLGEYDYQKHELRVSGASGTRFRLHIERSQKPYPTRYAWSKVYIL